MDILQKLVRVHPPATSVFKKITFDDKKPLAIFYDNTKPAASDYVSGPFGPGKIYQKQPAVSCATCGIRPAALQDYVMQYVKKCSYPIIILIFPITILLSHQKKFLSGLCAKIIRLIFCCHCICSCA